MVTTGVAPVGAMIRIATLPSAGGARCSVIVVALSDAPGWGSWASAPATWVTAAVAAAPVLGVSAAVMVGPREGNAGGDAWAMGIAAGVCEVEGVGMELVGLVAAHTGVESGPAPACAMIGDIVAAIGSGRDGADEPVLGVVASVVGAARAALDGADGGAFPGWMIAAGVGKTKPLKRKADAVSVLLGPAARVLTG